MICQDAINRKEIPASLAKNKESWYSKYDLESYFNLKGTALTNWIKKGIIKHRDVMHNGKSHVRLFLMKDNEGFLPPKKLVESQMIKETKDAKTWFRSEPWYKFVGAEDKLKAYGIMEHLRFTVVDNAKDK